MSLRPPTLGRLILWCALLLAVTFGGVTFDRMADVRVGTGMICVQYDLQCAEAIATNPGGGYVRQLRYRSPIKVYAYQAHATTLAGARGWADFLISAPTGPAPNQGGPYWKARECYASAYAGAPDRQVPSDPHSLAAGSWPAGYVPYATNGDWCTFQTQPGDSGTQMVFYLEADAAALVKVGICPLDNWVAGGADSSPPGWMAGCFASGDLNGAGALISFATGNGRYSAVADASMVQLISHIAAINWGYFGELDGCKSDGVPPDDRCFVAWDTPSSYFFGTVEYFNRLSPVDDATVLVVGNPSMPVDASARGAFKDVATGGDAGLLGKHIAQSLVVNFKDGAAHNHKAGTARGMMGYNHDAGAFVQTTDLCWLGFTSSANYPGPLVRWNCATAYPGAAAITISHGGAVEVPRDWMYPTGGGF